MTACCLCAGPHVAADCPTLDEWTRSAVNDALGRPCGTYAAVWRHRRRGEALDDACRQAERDYNREYGRQRRAAA